MSGVAGRRIRAFGGLILLAGAGIFAATTAEAAPSQKTYTASINTPSLVGLGQHDLEITLSNTSPTNTFNAVRLQWPSRDIPSPAVQPPFVWDPSLYDHGAIVGSNLNVAPGSAVSVSFSVTFDEPQAVCTSYTFVSDVRQSNDFNGVKNLFALVGHDASVTPPCSSTTVECDPGDTCAQLTSGNKNIASFTLNGTNGTLDASLNPPGEGPNCSEYTATSDQVLFDVTENDGGTITVTATQPVQAGKPNGEDYQVCFQAEYDFVALLPSQLVQDTARQDFRNNTQVTPATGSTPALYTGLLLTCDVTFQLPPAKLLKTGAVPCISSRSVVDGVATVVVEAPAADPPFRF